MERSEERIDWAERVRRIAQDLSSSPCLRQPLDDLADEMDAALAPFRALVAAYPHEVDGWLVTHTEPGLTLGDVRRLVGEGR